MVDLGVWPAVAGRRYGRCMARRDSLVLRVFAGWTVFVWAVLVRNMLKDSTHTIGFRVVHIGLAVVSITLAVLAWGVSTRLRRRSARDEQEASVEPAAPRA